MQIWLTKKNHLVVLFAISGLAKLLKLCFKVVASIKLTILTDLSKICLNSSDIFSHQHFLIFMQKYFFKFCQNLHDIFYIGETGVKLFLQLKINWNPKITTFFLTLFRTYCCCESKTSIIGIDVAI
jgi:hypothetical protein